MSIKELRDLKNSIDLCLGNDSSYVNKNLAQVINDFQVAFKEPLEDSRLAHFKYAIEDIDRTLNSKIRPIIYDKFSKLNGVGNDDSFVSYTQRGYIVSINEELDSHNKRFLIGHELSHILISITKDQIYSTNQNVDKNRERVASILSYVMIKLQGAFYKNKTNEYFYDDNTEQSTKLLETLNESIKKASSC